MHLKFVEVWHWQTFTGPISTCCHVSASLLRPPKKFVLNVSNSHCTSPKVHLPFYYFLEWAATSMVHHARTTPPEDDVVRDTCPSFSHGQSGRATSTLSRRGTLRLLTCVCFCGTRGRCPRRGPRWRLTNQSHTLGRCEPKTAVVRRPRWYLWISKSDLINNCRGRAGTNCEPQK